MFNGKKYEFSQVFSYKSDAKIHAKYLRRRGKLVRVIKVPYGYEVYKRNK